MMEREHLPKLKGFVSITHICFTCFVSLLRNQGRVSVTENVRNPPLKGKCVNTYVRKDGRCLILEGNEEENVPINLHLVVLPF